MDIWVFLGLTAGCAGAVRVMPRAPERWRVAGSVLVALVFFAVAPMLLDDFRLFQLSRAALWVTAAMGLNMLTGYNGQISLGQGAFVLIGAYVGAVLLDGDSQLGFVDAGPWPYWAAIIAGGLVTGAFGLVLGFPALRLSGPYLAIATLALMISMPSIIRKYEELTGGSQGLIIDQPEAPLGLSDQINRDEWLYLVMLGLTVLMLLIAWSVLRGPLGRTFVAVRESETAAAAMGVNVARTKVTAFTISAVYAGVAGGALTVLLGVMTPESVDITTSINFLTAIVIGGIASILGSVIGGIVLVLLPSEGPELAAKLPFISEDTVNRAPGAIMGLLVIIVVLAMPYGAAGAWHRARALTARGVMAGLRTLPAGLRSRVSEVRENIRWWWDDLPWRREGTGATPGDRP